MIKWTLEDYEQTLKEIDTFEHIAGAAYVRWKASQDKEDWDLFVQATDKLGRLIDKRNEQDEADSSLAWKHWLKMMDRRYEV